MTASHDKQGRQYQRQAKRMRHALFSPDPLASPPLPRCSSWRRSSPTATCTCGGSSPRYLACDGCLTCCYDDGTTSSHVLCEITPFLTRLPYHTYTQGEDDIQGPPPTHDTPTTMDFLPSTRKGSGNASANDLNSPGLVFRGRGGTPRTSSNPNGFEVQVDLETQQPAGGMGESNGAGARRVSAGSGASAGMPYMQQQQQQYQQPMQQQGMAPPEVCARSGGGRAWVDMCLCVCLLG